MEKVLHNGIDILCEDAAFAALFYGREDSIISALELYVEEIERFNSVCGLVSYKTKNELIIRHILDSLAPLGIIMRELQTAFPDLKEQAQICDFGSGAGLPGIPLAITFGKTAFFTLIERIPRRVNFLYNALALLSLKNVNIFDSDAEKADFQFNALCFRAVSELNKKFTRRFMRLLLPGGFIVAYKGLYQNAAREAANFSGVNTKIISYKSPMLDEERALLVLFNA
ncbi:MAG: 16S rRNA (guanine(527)-N(7))-methyltransferase RsmG [Spirochaetaceae bacterium]|jgi:16S rRNA (guanine527-N7)-methyltransferase|nr:16S rRNA (guanine(527)-N(7))-methyltransferase RsmG [Spirochaetaceae bacterium]